MARVVGVGIALIVSLVMAQISPAHADGVVRYITPSDWFGGVIAKAGPNDTIVLTDGLYTNLVVKDVAKTNVTIKGASRDGVTVRGLTFSNASGFTASEMTVTSSPTVQTSAVRVMGASSAIALTGMTVRQTVAKGIAVTDTSHHVTIADNVIDGSLVTTGEAGRGVYIEGLGASTNWPSYIDVRGNDISGNRVDNVFVAGGRNVVISDNYLHDLQHNDLHNDGVQVVAGLKIEITRNLFTSPGPTSEPDQGVILGTLSTDRPIADVLISNNIIRDWRGTGIIVAGASNTRIVNNSIARTGGTTFRAASVLSQEQNGILNTSLAVWNNMIESINTAGGSVTYEDFNCVRNGTGANDISADPQIADLDTLQLAPTSPCIGAGTDLDDTPLVDFGSTPRTGPVTLGAWTA